MYIPSATKWNGPGNNVTPVNPMVVINELPSLSKQADTTQSKLTTNERNLPVLADVLINTKQPVYPAENADPEILISIKRFYFELLGVTRYIAYTLRPQSAITTLFGIGIFVFA